MVMLSNRKETGFTLIELMILVGIIAVLAGMLFPSLSRAKLKARTAYCQNNSKQIGLGARMYTTDQSGRLFEAAFNEIYGTGHPIGNLAEAGGLRQWLLPDRLTNYVASRRTFECPGLQYSATTNERGKFLTAGSYDFMCGHESRSRSADTDSSPVRLFLAYYGPLGIAKNGDGRDILAPERFFSCGQNVETFKEPELAPLSFCDSFGVHSTPSKMRWEHEFLPQALGGVESYRGLTIVSFCDGHVELVRGSFSQIIDTLGVTKSRKPK